MGEGGGILTENHLPLHIKKVIQAPTCLDFLHLGQVVAIHIKSFFHLCIEHFEERKKMIYSNLSPHKRLMGNPCKLKNDL